MRQCDVAIIGSGMAGASAAFEIAKTRRVVLLERESVHAYHTTGRSAALFTEAYGNRVIRGLTVGSRGFLLTPPAGFCETVLLTPRGVLLLARDDQMAAAVAEAERSRRLVPSVRLIDARLARALVPILREDYVAGAILEPEAMDIDVHALHQAFLRGARTNGAEIVTDAELLGLTDVHGGWLLETRAGPVQAGIVVNASGAWADEVAAMAGAVPVGLTPKRRTAMTVQPPVGADIRSWPTVIDVDEQFYFKPDAGRLLASPADETPMAACDAQPDELDIAIAIDRIQKAADLPVRRIERSWAGLRSFVADKSPVVGFDPAVAGFFWLAGQGGYGIQTSPAMSRVAAALLGGDDIPTDLADLGVTKADLAPARCHV